MVLMYCIPENGNLRQFVAQEALFQLFLLRAKEEVFEVIEKIMTHKA